MQTRACLNAAAARRQSVERNSRDPDDLTAPSDDATASHRRPDAPLTGEQPIEPESLTDIQDEKDPEGYGFGV